MILWTVLKTHPKLIRTLVLDWRRSSARALGLLSQSNATHRFLVLIPPYPAELLSIFVPVPPMQKTPSSVMRKRVLPVFWLRDFAGYESRIVSSASSNLALSAKK